MCIRDSSIIIFAGIVATLPTAIGGLWLSFDVSQVPLYLGVVAAVVAITYAVVFMTEAERPVPITYAKQSRGGKTYGGTTSYLPLRLGQAGVIPIIFALSLLLLPQLALNILASFEIAGLEGFSQAVLNFLNNPISYAATYFVLVILFTFFYTAITFDPEAVAKNLQRSGAFVPGIRPGGNTTDYLGKVMTRLTLVGALFLGLIAVLPLGMQALTGIQTLAIGGTALLISVSVVLDIIRRLDAQVSLRDY